MKKRFYKTFTNFYIRWMVLLVIAGVIVVGALLFINYKNKPFCNKCNVILVSIDTLSALHLPCYGYARNTAPNLCKFANENITFLNSYSQSPTTFNSHFSIFTSLYPHTSKMQSIFGEPLDEKYKTLPQVLRNSGYFAIYHGSLNDSHLNLTRGLERGFDIKEGYSDIKTWDTAYNKIKQEFNSKKPFFAFLHFYNVHDPYLTGHASKHLFTNQPEVKSVPLTDYEYHSITEEMLEYVKVFFNNENNILQKFPNITNDQRIFNEIMHAKSLKDKKRLFYKLSFDSQIFIFTNWYSYSIASANPPIKDYVRALYDEQIFYMDKELKNLIDLVESPEFANNTILIITSDHGEEFMEHGNYFHGGNLYATSTRVPLIIHIPGVQPQKITDLAQGIDIYPTILSLVGLKPLSSIEGIDLAGIIKDDKNTVKNQYLLSEFNGREGIQKDDWRFYYDNNRKEPTGLFDLSSDPLEQNNVLNTNHQKASELINLAQSLNLPQQ